MFTGIIEETGKIIEFKKDSAEAFIKVECKKVLENTKIGDSIAINGVCQTVTNLGANYFCANISSQTLLLTTFSSAKTGDKVNLERALSLQSRLGGHFVSGHIDGVAKILNIQKQNNFYNLSFEIPENFTKYIVNQGSITFDGISLTVAQIASNEVKVAIIPHTFENTNLKSLKTGDFVNLECDILAKYVEKNLSTENNKSKLSESFLKENGFF